MFALLFVLASFTSGFLFGTNPRLMERYFSTETVQNLEEMYDPDADHYLEPRQVSGDADMFGYYIYNNVSIAFRTFAGGVLAGLGSLLFFLYNAVFLGAASGGTGGPGVGFVITVPLMLASFAGGYLYAVSPLYTWLAITATTALSLLLTALFIRDPQTAEA